MRSLTGRILLVVALAAAAVLFAVQNGAVHVTVRVGTLTLRSVSLPVVVFTAIVAGMLLVFFAGLRADLRSRRMMRRYRDALGGSSEET